jgi:hypothetical protein
MFGGVAGGQRVTGRGVEVGQRGCNIVVAVVGRVNLVQRFMVGHGLHVKEAGAYKSKKGC